MKVILVADVKNVGKKGEVVELIEKGKNVVIIPHYVSEQYGYKKFYDKIKDKLEKKKILLKSILKQIRTKV